MRGKSGDTADSSVIDVIRPEPDLLQFAEEATDSIVVDSLFSKDLTVSGSFDLRQIKNVSLGKLLSSLPLPTFMIDSSGKIAFFNERVTKPDGVPYVVGTQFSALFPHPQDRERAVAMLDEVLHERRTQVFEGLVQIYRKNRWCKIHLRSVRFRNERSVLAIVEDLTAEKKQALLGDKYARLVRIFPIGIAEFSLGRLVSVSVPAEQILPTIAQARFASGNPEFARISGDAGVDELRGTYLADLVPFGGSYELVYRNWIRSGFASVSFESRHVEADAATRFFENTLVGNVKNETLQGIWVMRKDITHQKESEESLRATRDMLEERVKERTAELVRTNEILKQEIQERQRAQDELANLVGELQDALAQVKTLRGLLPICASCKKIRDDTGYWTQVEVFVRQHSEAEFTHSICPDCARKLYPELYDAAMYNRDR